MIVLAAVAGLGAYALADRRVAEWTGTIRGHQVRLVARQNTTALYVDGEQVAQKTTLRGSGASLTWELETGGDTVIVTGAVVYPDRGGPVGRIHADGQWIGGAEGPGLLSTTGAPEPQDPRWTAANVLLADLRDGRHGEAAQRIEAGLREVLGGLDRLANVGQAHRALGGDDVRVEAARARLDGQAAELLDALRDVHLLALADGDAFSQDRLDDLLARVAADAEVQDGAGRRARVPTTGG
jgi:hypothetical protein